MKVIYSSVIMNRIREIADAALRENRKIDRIELTLDEVRDLRKEFRESGFFYPCMPLESYEIGYVYGVRITRET